MKNILTLTAMLFAVLSLITVAPASALSPEQLGNTVYHGIYDDAIQLEDGTYEGEPFQEGGASRPTVTLLDALIAFGDLNGDGSDDAALVLNEDSGGSGTFSYLAVVLNDNEQPFNEATLSLGDRVSIKSIAIEDAQVVVEFIEQNEKVRKRYQFSFGESDSENLGALSFSDLEGVEWVLTSLAPDQELVADTEITAIFDEGKINGSSGCNHYSASVTDKQERALEFGPSVGTRKACPEAIMKQEHDFLAALGTVSQFSFSGGQLVLESENGSLFFQSRHLEQEETVTMSIPTTSLKKLDGSKWVLTELEAGQALEPGTEITIEFSGGKISGSNGCNHYSANITEKEAGEISIGMAMGTMKSCPEAVMDQENAFMAKLVSVTQANLTEDGRLELINEHGNLIFAPPIADDSE